MGPKHDAQHIRDIVDCILRSGDAELRVQIQNELRLLTKYLRIKRLRKLNFREKRAIGEPAPFPYKDKDKVLRRLAWIIMAIAHGAALAAAWPYGIVTNLFC